MKKILLILAISFVILNSSIVIVEAQLQGQARIDSIRKELPKMKQDTNGVNLLSDLSFTYSTINPDEGVKYGKQGLMLANKISWNPGIARCCFSLGVVYSFGKSDHLKALEYHKKALNTHEELGNKNDIAKILLNIGNIYVYQANYSKALEYYHKALIIYENLEDKSGIAATLGNIGTIYVNQSDYPKALDYFSRGLKLKEELGQKFQMASNFSNMGVIYTRQTNYIKALEYFQKSLKIEEEFGNKTGIAVTIGNMGNVYLYQSDYSKALDYYHKALNIYNELGNNSGIATSLRNIGDLYLSQSIDSLSKNGDNKEKLMLNEEIILNKAIEFLKQAIEMYKACGEDLNQTNSIYSLVLAYKRKGDYKNAFEALKEVNKLDDSIYSIEKQKQIANLETKRENELKDAEIKLLQTQKKAQKFQSYLLVGGVIVLFVGFVVAFLGFREKKKLSDKLAMQKSEIENQKGIVESQMVIVEGQKEILQEKNNQIYASITYASTIQHAILPWDSTLYNAFSDILLFYKPKDIVSGDSYWFQEVDGIMFLAVIDCTGHGIPGAMLTVIASTSLDDAVLGKRIYDTGQILTYMNDKVTEVLNQRLAENSIRDGMEVALVAIHKDKIQFSGAGRPLYLKNGIIEIVKTDKRGIAGQSENDVYKFSSIEIEKVENMTIYLATDGFADQMNQDSKKYSTKRFVALLDSISEKPIIEQYKLLENEFNSHKGERSQIDDITILGVRL